MGYDEGVLETQRSSLGYFAHRVNPRAPSVQQWRRCDPARTRGEPIQGSPSISVGVYFVPQVMTIVTRHQV